MSHARNKRNKRRRRALFEILPQLKIVHRFIRFEKVPRYTFLRDEKRGGALVMRFAEHLNGDNGEKGRVKVYVHAWKRKSTFQEQLNKGVEQLQENRKKKAGASEHEG